MDISPPLKPQVLHILLALAGDERHGYAIMQTVREQSGGTVPIRTGSFYRHMAALIDAGLVEQATGRREHDDPRRGAYYRLTADGRRVLQAEKQRLVALVAAFPRGTGVPRKGRA